MGHSFPLFQMRTSCAVLGTLESVPMTGKRREEETQPEGPAAVWLCAGLPEGRGPSCVAPKVAPRSQGDRDADFSSKKKAFPKS